MAVEKEKTMFDVGEAPYKEGIVWHSVFEPEFMICGLLTDPEGEDRFYRVPKSVAQQCKSADNMITLYPHTCGGRVRFVTDSEYVAIRCKWKTPMYIAPHMPLTGTAGFDLYLTEEDGTSHFFKNFGPPFWHGNVDKDHYRSCGTHFADKRLRDVTINFPLYNGVAELEIGIHEDAVLKKTKGYRLDKPVVFYGSSVTQGGCASRPGLCYPSVVARALHLDHINLGFSDSARGDKAMAEYIASLPISAFVYDYDHNASTAQWLKDTHYPFYEIVRKAHPDIPIICLSRPTMGDHDWPGRAEDAELRRQIIQETVSRAKANGDENIYFVSGANMFGAQYPGDCLVDGTHPNDVGFYFMAQAVIPVLKNALHLD